MNKELRDRLYNTLQKALNLMVQEGVVTTTKIKIEGPTPSKKNSRKVNFKTKRTYLDPRYQEWYECALMQIAALEKKQIEETVMFDICFYHSTKRRKDPDNGLSSVLDLFVDAEVLKDDKWMILPFIVLRNEFGAEDKCEVTIYTEMNNERVNSYK